MENVPEYFDCNLNQLFSLMGRCSCLTVCMQICKEIIFAGIFICGNIFIVRLKKIATIKASNRINELSDLRNIQQLTKLCQFIQ